MYCNPEFKKWCIEELDSYWLPIPERCNLCTDLVKQTIETLHSMGDGNDEG